MTALEAVRAVCAWLSTIPGLFRLEVAQETVPTHFQVVVRQLPEQRQRVFAMEPLECADCWEVKEMVA